MANAAATIGTKVQLISVRILEKPKLAALACHFIVNIKEIVCR